MVSLKSILQALINIVLIKFIKNKIKIKKFAFQIGILFF